MDFGHVFERGHNGQSFLNDIEQHTRTFDFHDCISKEMSTHADKNYLSTDVPLNTISIPLKHPSWTIYDWNSAAVASHPKVNHAHSQGRITSFSLGSRTIET